MPEGIQGDGLTGLALTRRWLESTTWMELPLEAYFNQNACTLERLDGKTKVFDSRGTFHFNPPDEVFVENKAANGENGQTNEHWEFLANAYSISARARKVSGRDPRYHFIWVTTFPFAQNDWTTLCSASRMTTALTTKHPEALGGEQIDVDFLNVVASRTWMLVLHQKQEGLLLSPEELGLVEGVLKRKKRD